MGLDSDIRNSIVLHPSLTLNGVKLRKTARDTTTRPEAVPSHGARQERIVSLEEKNPIISGSPLGPVSSNTPNLTPLSLTLPSLGREMVAAKLGKDLRPTVLVK